MLQEIDFLHEPVRDHPENLLERPLN